MTRKLTKAQLRRLAGIEDRPVRAALADFEHYNASRYFPEDNLFKRDKNRFHSGNAERYMSGIVPDIITVARLSDWGFPRPE